MGGSTVLMFWLIVLQVDEGGKATLSLDHIEISDPDTQLSQLNVTVETQPSFGVIRNIDEGKFKAIKKS